jgi:hypothetical protein
MEKIRFLLSVKIRIILVSSPVEHDFSTAFSNNRNLLILQFSSNFWNLLSISFFMNEAFLVILFLFWHSGKMEYNRSHSLTGNE